MPAALPANDRTAQRSNIRKIVQPLHDNASFETHAVASGDKKKKKKKRKSRATLDEDEPQSRELWDGTPRSRTGLSPELESVHISTTASLSNMVSPDSQEQLNMSPSARSDLLSDLYHKIGIDAADAVTDEIRDSLDAVPGGMHAFVQSALSSMANLGLGADEIKQRALYAIAQQMLQSGMGGRGIGLGALKRETDDTSLNFEPGSLPDFPMDQALERLVTGKGIMPTRHAQTLRADVMLSHEFLDKDDDLYEDELYSEDEVDEGVEELDMHMRMGIAQMRFRGEAETLPESGHFSVSYEEDIVPLESAFTPKKKSKKKKKKNGVTRSVAQDTSDDAAEPRPQPKNEPGVPVAHSKTGSRPIGVTDGVTRSQTTPNPPTRQNAVMPTRPSANPPPSSRAAGKQPMTYAQPPAATTNNPAPASNPPRSARAAAKAPAHQQPYSHTHAHHHPSPPSSNASAPQKHRPPAASAQNGANANTKSNNKIWSTNTTEERERIKEFWLGLSEEERRALVKIEKEAVLRKMKEQQKHSCTCAVCGRKRNAIEEELEVLYDAYYEELEQYANYQQRYASSGGTLPPPPGPGPFPGSVELDKNGLVVGPGGKTHPLPPSARGKNPLNGTKGTVPPGSEFGDDPDGEYDEDEYDDEEEDEEDEDRDDDADVDNDSELPNRNTRRANGIRDRSRGAPNGTKTNGRDDLFSFGSRLTAAGPGNILTVADDLLKNDGQKFLEMMEQLAERRMQREEDAAANVAYSDEDEDEDDEDVDDEDEDDGVEDDDDDEMLTEEQKVEEGKRMFSIFAARMFEQRVLSAYREKVAQERQNQLLRELEDEQAATKEKEAKKAKENQRKKDRRRQVKLAKDEERAARAAQQAAEEAARKNMLKAEEEARLEKKKKEREAARKAADEEKQRKMEKQMRLQEEQVKRKEKLERERERERQAKADREAKLAAERAKDKAKEEEKRAALEREGKEKERQQMRATAAATAAVAAAAAAPPAAAPTPAAATAVKPRIPASPRSNAVASSSSQRQQQSPNPAATTPKKILIKPSTQPSPAPAPQPMRQPSRSAVLVQPTSPATPQHTAPSPTHSSPVTSSNGTQSMPVHPQSAPVSAPPVISPRATFAAAPGLPPFSTYLPQVAPPHPIGPPSSMPRPFGAGPPFGLASATPIGPPKAPIGNPILSPIAAPGQPVPNRRMSGADPGPITRPAMPIAPIARPTNGINGDATGSGTGSGGTSPSRRSPSPKGVLGSSALAADDDEVVSAPGRRSAPAPLQQMWMNSRNAAGPTPWGPPPTSGFSSPRALTTNVNMGLWGPAGNPPPMSPNASLNEWAAHPPHPNSHFYGSAPPFLHPAAATPPPHSSGN